VYYLSVPVSHISVSDSLCTLPTLHLRGNHDLPPTLAGSTVCFHPLSQLTLIPQNYVYQALRCQKKHITAMCFACFSSPRHSAVPRFNRSLLRPPRFLLFQRMHSANQHPANVIPQTNRVTCLRAERSTCTWVGFLAALSALPPTHHTPAVTPPLLF
jgi:hypothetical protein